MAYPLIMAFTLVYTAEHYVIDILLGWVLAAVVVTASTAMKRGGGSRSSSATMSVPPT